ncbi:MAM and LDL-receptor class A domain-containing protein 1-like, partial [Centruroides vittatus]|uniref:MAM and LDL-receptor class A domain-containing protein 1-like n=1 Tax=Centruroides vittatus TaxID=120091 RepID=UPI0035101EE2
MEPFSLSFSRVTVYSTNEIFALDNIKFENCSYPKEEKNCPISKFYCRKSKACIDRDLICDLSDDCGDGSDENGCDQDFLISFEEGLKFFYQDKNDDIDWDIGNGVYKSRLKYKTGPPFDHTYFLDKGNYIFITSETSSPNKVARLISDVLEITRNGMCSLRFYYYMFGNLVSDLKVYIRTLNNRYSKPVWFEKGSRGDYWKRSSIQLNVTSPFQIVIEGKTGNRYEDVIALDDISLRGDCQITSRTSLSGWTETTPSGIKTTLRPGECPEGYWYCLADKYCISDQRKCDFRVDCSDGSDEDGCVKPNCTFVNNNLCGWKIKIRSKRFKRDINDNIFTWTVTKASDSKIKDHPAADSKGNKTGWYVIADSSLGQKSDITTLETPFISRTHAQCKFRLWYYCDILHCPLTVQSSSEIMDGLSQSQPWYPDLTGESLKPASQWRQANIYLSNAVKSKMEIQATKIYDTSIAIDEPSFDQCEPPAAIQKDKTQCDEDMFMCNNKECIKNSLQCDFSNDCTDGSDELDAFCEDFYERCSFEKDICSTWEVEAGTNKYWKLFKQNDYVSALLPKTDHTKVGQGSYLAIEKKYSSPEVEKARLASYVITGSSGNNCFVKFWFNLIGQNNSLNVYRRNSYSETGLKLLSSYKNNTKIWESSEIKLTDQENNYKVVFEGELGSGIGSVGLDDLSISRSCQKSEDNLPGEPIGTPPPYTDCGPDRFQCKNGNCYAREQRCNFADECGDGSDEADCGTDCDFEDGMCGWYNPKGYSAQWIIATPSDIQSRINGPNDDHTFRNASGHFIYPGEGTFSKPTDVAQLYSKVYTKSAVSCTVNFWYHMYYRSSEKIGNLRILVKTANNKKILSIWDRSGSQGNRWHEGVAEINKQDDFSIIIEATRGTASKNFVSIDDIEFKSCSQDYVPVECSFDEWMCKKIPQCIKKWQRCDKFFDCKDKTDELNNCNKQKGDCDFNDENWIESCQWEHWPEKSFKWSRANESPSKKTGPPYDHSINVKGYYLYIDSGNHSIGDSAAVSTQSLPASKEKCHLRYWYFMYGSKSMGKLTVSIYGNKGQIIPVNTISGPIEKKWNYAHAKINSVQDYKIVFEGFVGGDEYTDIAIDDVTFTEECQEGGTAIIPTGVPPLCDKAVHFMCREISQCISSEWLCDCYSDCEDGSDEQDCDIDCTTLLTESPSSTTAMGSTTKSVRPTRTTATTTTKSSPATPVTHTTFRPTVNCKKNEFECGDKTCIPRIYLCDEYEDCKDGSDEKGFCSSVQCNQSNYFCHDRHCVREELICDGTKQCSDGSDESMCDLTECPPNYCQNGATCKLNKNNFPICSCNPSHIGKRCVKAADVKGKS